MPWVASTATPMISTTDGGNIGLGINWKSSASSPNVSSKISGGQSQQIKPCHQTIRSLRFQSRRVLAGRNPSIRYCNSWAGVQGKANGFKASSSIEASSRVVSKAGV